MVESRVSRSYSMDGWVSVIVVVVVVVGGGGGGRGAAVDEGGVDHRQVEAGGKHVGLKPRWSTGISGGNPGGRPGVWA